MPLESFGDVEFGVLLENLAPRTLANSARTMRRLAIRVQKMAIRMAPRDFGNLEHAIKVEGIGGGRDEESGHFMRKEWVVYVDPDEPADQPNEQGEARKKGTTVGKYLARTYESGGSGYRSFEKQMMDPEVEVGPHFLERAMEHVGKSLDVALVGILNSEAEYE